jgi:membrane-bound lytic murein transglycosylase B
LKDIIVLFFVCTFGWVIYSHSKSTGGAVRDSAPVRCYEKVGKKYTRLPAWRCGYRTGVINRTPPQPTAPSAPTRTMDSVPQTGSSDLNAVNAASHQAKIDPRIALGLWGHEGDWSTDPNGVGPLARASVLAPLCIDRKRKMHKGMSRAKAIAWCRATLKKAFAALNHMCTGQGRRVCDPHKVRMQWAGDTGPFQILVQHVFPRNKDGSFGRASWAVDANRDGVINLFSLEDAAATALGLLHWKNKNQCNNSGMRCAVNYYWGSQKEKLPGKQYYDIVLETAALTCKKKPHLCAPPLLASK